MSLIEHLKGEIEAIGILIEQKTKEVEQLVKRKADIEKEISSPAKEEPVEETTEVEETVEEEAPVTEEEEVASYSSWDRDQLKAELEAREVEFAKNAKTEKLVELLEESDQ